jgi:hypothetical protein
LKSRMEMERIRWGIWIDHAEAILVRFGPDGEAGIRRIESGVAGRAKSTGGMSGFSGQIGGASHKKPERRRLNQLSRFYEEVVATVEDADEIAIIGPGKAKKNFETKLRELNADAEVVAVLPADRLTDGQVVARLRKILRVPAPGAG